MRNGTSAAAASSRPRRWLSLHGLPPEAPLHQLDELLPLLTLEPDDFEAARRALRRTPGGRTSEVELEYRVAIDGQLRWVHMRGRCPARRGGRPLRFFCAASDVSARKQVEAERAQLESQLRQAQHLRRSARWPAASRTTSTTSSAPSSATARWPSAIRPEGSPLRRHLDRVMQGGARAKLLVRRILDFSRSSVRERTLVHLQMAIDEALLLLAPSLPSSVRLQTTLQGGRAAMLGDPTQVHQLVSNLCMNAVGAMPEGGEL